MRDWANKSGNVGLVLGLLMVLGCSSNGSNNGANQSTVPQTFTTINQTIFQTSCNECHSFTYEALISNELVIPGDAQNSPLCSEVQSQSMPPQGSPALTANQITAICSWIQNGAAQ